MRARSVVVERGTLGRGDEQQQPPGAALGVLQVDDQAVGHLGQCLDHGVQLGRAHADPSAVEGGVGAARDHARPVGEHGDPVAVGPHARVVGEVGGPVPRPVVVAPEPHRHRRHRRGDDQLSLLPHQRPPRLVERLDAGAEIPARDLAGPHRHERAPTDERRAHVGSAADRRQQHVALHRVVDPLEPLGGQRRPGRSDGPQRGEVGVAARCQALLATGEDEGRRRAEERHALVGRHAPQRLEPGVAGIAVEQHGRGSDQQARHQVVPHHPARGREPEEAVARAEIVVQGQHLVVLDEDAAVAVDDRLGQPGGPRRVEDVQAGGRTAPARTRARPGAPGRARVDPAGRPTASIPRGGRPRRPPPGTAPSPSPARTAVRRGWRPPRRPGRSPWPRSGSRRPPAARSARSDANGRRRCGCRTRGRTTTRSPPGWRWRGGPRPSRGRSGGRPPHGRRGAPRAPPARRGTAPPGPAARPSRPRPAPWSATARPERVRAAPTAARARRSSARAGEPARPRHDRVGRGPTRPACASPERSGPRSTARSRRGR